MTDYFAVLNEPRRLWLDPEALKKKFLAMSSTLHPDRVHDAGIVEKAEAQRRYAELNAAYQCLREPRERLRHFLEVERGKLDPIQKVPSALLDISFEIGQACRQTDELLTEKRKAASALLQLGFFDGAQAQVEKLTTLLQRLESLREPLICEIKEMDAHWHDLKEGESRSATLTRSETIYHLLSYYERWSSQVRERIVQLAL